MSGKHRRRQHSAESLAKYPLYFDDLFVNLVEAGEQAVRSKRCSINRHLQEKTEALKKKIKKAMFYPAAVLIVAVVVSIILLIFVIPQFEELFKGFGADLRRSRRWSSIYPASCSIRLVDGIVVVCSCLCLLLFLQAVQEHAAVVSIGRCSNSQSSVHSAEIGHSALCPDAVDHVRRPACLFRGNAVGRRGTGNIVYEEATLRMKDEVATGPALAARHGECRTFSEHGRANDRGSAKNRVPWILCPPRWRNSTQAEVDNAVDSMSSLLER